jgi:hypothetical protein
MLLQSPVRLPSHPLESPDPIQLRRDSAEDRQAFERVFGGSQRGAHADQAAVVQFGAQALGLARSQESAADAEDGADAAAATGSTEEAASDTPANPSKDASAVQGTVFAAEALSDDEQKSVDQMRQRDREVRTHEQAHKSAGGAYAGSMRLSFQMGPDGKRYAVEGSVPIDVSPVAGDPAATLRKMEVVHRAANAPANPSGADRSVAAQASRVAQQARAQMAAERYAAAQQLVP